MTVELPKLPEDLTPRDRDLIDHVFIGMIEAFDGPILRENVYTGAAVADLIRIMQSLARQS